MIERQEAGHELVWSWSKCGRDRGVIWTIGGVFIVSHWRFSIAISAAAALSLQTVNTM